MFTLEEILEQIKMPREAADLGLACFDRIKNDTKILNLKNAFFSDEDIESDLDEYAHNKGMSALILKLAFCFLCVDVMYNRFKKQGFSDEIYIDSLVDLRIWTLTCKKNYGEWGMKEFCWLARALRGRLFRLGRLQFEKAGFEAKHYERAGYSVNEGDIVLNTHIPEDGPMSAESRLHSYRQAYEKFGINIFVCESYLLYPAQYEFLSPESNIISFMDEFDIIKSGEDSKMNDMWRIFGLRDNYAPETLPRETSLQRAYAEHIAKTGKNGWGYGVLIFDGEKIVK